MSGYLDRQLAGFQAGAETGERLARQFDIDCFQIALSRYERLNLGFQRIMEITNLAEQVRAEYRPALASPGGRTRGGCLPAPHGPGANRDHQGQHGADSIQCPVP